MGQGTDRGRGAVEELRGQAHDPLCLFEQRAGHLRSRHGDGRRGRDRRGSRHRRSCGTAPSRPRTPGATASPWCRSRTRAGSSKGAITRTSPSSGSSRRSRRVATGSCSRWRPEPARPSSPFRSPGSCSKVAGTCRTGKRTARRRGDRGSSSSPIATSSPTRATTPFRPFRKMPWCGSPPRTSARKARCRRTATSSSPSSRPS